MKFSRLFIAEKPSMGKSIAQCLPGKMQYHSGKRGPTHITVGEDIVTWGIGHLFELAKPEEYSDMYRSWNVSSLPIEVKDWILNPMKDTKEQVSVIKKLVKGCSLVVHACDPDREGQLIGDQILEFVGNRKPVKRLLLPALDEKTIRKGLANLTDNSTYHNLKLAAEARQRADWLVGMNLTRLYTKAAEAQGRDDGVVNVGRVLTPTLAILEERHYEIKNFVSKPFYGVKAILASGEESFSATWKATAGLDSEGRLIEKPLADAAVQRLTGTNGIVTKYEAKDVVSEPRLPYSLNELQRDAIKLLGFTAQQTLEVAQDLYEAKLTSYPRSDCEYLPKSQKDDAAGILGNLPEKYQEWVARANLQLESPAWNDSRLSAHHAIIPTGVKPVGLTKEKEALYDLIAGRYLMQFLPPSVSSQTYIESDFGGDILETKGTTIKVLGWKAFANEALKESEQTLPRLAVGSPLVCQSADLESKKTTAPKKHTEDTLISSMMNIHKSVTDPEVKKRLRETSGIGTEATRAATIEGLKRSGFIVSHKGSLDITEKGLINLAALPNLIKSAGLTALFEQFLEGIAEGKVNPEQFMQKQMEFIKKQVDEVKVKIQRKPSTGGFRIQPKVAEGVK